MSDNVRSLKAIKSRYTLPVLMDRTYPYARALRTGRVCTGLKCPSRHVRTLTIKLTVCTLCFVLSGHSASLPAYSRWRETNIAARAGLIV